MSEDPQDQTLRCRWLLRIRRSFGVPDLLNDDHAKTAIVGRLLVQHPMNTLPFDDAKLIVGKLVDALIDDYSAGLMDSSILADSEATWFDDQPSRGSVNERAFETHRGRPSDDASQAVLDMRDFVVSLVKQSVEAFPFEDGQGNYFGHDTD